MRVTVNGEEFEVISADVDAGEAVLPLLDAGGYPALQPDGTPDTVTRRGVVVILDDVQRPAKSDSGKK